MMLVVPILDQMVSIYPKCVVIWPFEEAPEYFKSLSPHGGDEMLIAYVPDGWTETGLAAIGFVMKLDDENVGPLGSSVKCVLVNGGTLYFGAHC